MARACLLLSPLFASARFYFFLLLLLLLTRQCVRLAIRFAGDVQSLAHLGPLLVPRLTVRFSPHTPPNSKFQHQRFAARALSSSTEKLPAAQLSVRLQDRKLPTAKRSRWAEQRQIQLWDPAPCRTSPLQPPAASFSRRRRYSGPICSGCRECNDVASHRRAAQNAQVSPTAAQVQRACGSASAS